MMFIPGFDEAGSNVGYVVSVDQNGYAGNINFVLGLDVEGKITGINIISSGEDRKSTRLNSSHANISYAVFCLKKKKKLRSVCHMPVVTIFTHYCATRSS